MTDKSESLEEKLFKAVVNDPAVLQAHTQLIREVAESARKRMEEITKDSCGERLDGVICELTFNHYGPHMGTVKWRNENDPWGGIADGNGDNRERR